MKLTREYLEDGIKPGTLEYAITEDVIELATDIAANGWEGELEPTIDEIARKHGVSALTIVDYFKAIVELYPDLNIDLTINGQ